MIVKHSNKRNSSNCTGVIIGWHRQEDKPIKLKKNSPSFQPDFRYDNSFVIMPFYDCCNNTFKKQKANYILLNEHNEMCYVKEGIYH